MEKLKYKTDGTKCYTNCPYRKGIKIVSYTCRGCDHFYEDNRIEKYVVCLYKENNKLLLKINELLEEAKKAENTQWNKAVINTCEILLPLLENKQRKEDEND